MLDIKFIKENQKLVKENIKKKGQIERQPLVDQVVRQYEDSLKLKQEAEKLRHHRNELSEQINALVKQKKDASTIIRQLKSIPEEIKKLEETKEALELKIREGLARIPNIMHPLVPLGKDASENKVLKKWGKIHKLNFPVRNHVELGEALGMLNFEESAKTSGHGFYFLKGDLALLNQALIRFAIDFMMKKRYLYIE